MQKVNKQIVFIPQMICSTMKLINWKERRKRSQRKWSKYANISKSFNWNSAKHEFSLMYFYFLSLIISFTFCWQILEEKIALKKSFSNIKIAFCRSKTIKSFYLAEIKLSLFAESHICNQIISNGWLNCNHSNISWLNKKYL